jgi:hypothetical protein
VADNWKTLTELTQSREFNVERVRLRDSDIAIEGAFELPPLIQLPMDDQVFVMAFVRCHGSIKRMEDLFGVSYPTIKNRLNRIGERFPYVEVGRSVEEGPRGEALDLLDRGEITVEEALERLKR